jgi:hypothetical protein
LAGGGWGNVIAEKKFLTEAEMTAEQDVVGESTMRQGIRGSRFKVPRSRGAFSGLMLLVLGAWAALIPFVGPYFNFAFTPVPNDAWHWTAGRGWLELLPGAAAFVAGLLLLLGTNRLSLTFASWLGVAAGAWLVVGPVLAPRIGLNAGNPDPGSSPGVQTAEALLFYYALGAAIVFFAATALGRLSVHSVRDVRAAQRRVEAEAAREAEERRLAEERVAEERRLAQQRAAEQQAAEGNHAATQRPTTDTAETAAPRHGLGEGSANYPPNGGYAGQQAGAPEGYQPPRT